MLKSPRIDAVFCSFYYLCCEKYAVCCLIYLFFFFLIYVVRNMQSFVLVFLFISTYATLPPTLFIIFFFNKPISLKTKQNKKSTILPRRFQKRRRQITFITREIYFKSNNIFSSKMKG